VLGQLLGGLEVQHHAVAHVKAERANLVGAALGCGLVTGEVIDAQIKEQLVAAHAAAEGVGVERVEVHLVELHADRPLAAVGGLPGLSI